MLFNVIIKARFCSVIPCRGGSRVFERGAGGILFLGLQAKKGGPWRGSNFGPNVKKPTTLAKKRGSPESAHACNKAIDSAQCYSMHAIRL